MTILYTRWRFDKFYLQEEIRETLFTFKVHSAELLFYVLDAL